MDCSVSLLSRRVGTTDPLGGDSALPFDTVTVGSIVTDDNYTIVLPSLPWLCLASRA
ncbi:MAG: hypothetical protein GVY04_21685 [Cyanobacteria bacterium]|nr:hypothetical protein [Cyanobacteria bacterium GSL.Bin1]